MFFQTTGHAQGQRSTALAHAQHFYDLNISENDFDRQLMLVTNALVLGYDPDDPTGSPEDEIFGDLIGENHIDINQPSNYGSSISYLCQFAAEGMTTHTNHYQALLNSGKPDDIFLVEQSFDKILMRLKIAHADLSSHCGAETAYDLLERTIKWGIDDPYMSLATRSIYTHFLDQLIALGPRGMQKNGSDPGSSLKMRSVSESFQVENILVRFNRTSDPKCQSFYEESLVKNTVKAKSLFADPSTFGNSTPLIYHDFTESCLLYTWISRAEGKTAPSPQLERGGTRYLFR